MAHINLLPWRDERRKQREREFFIQLGAAFGAAVLVLVLWAGWMNLRIDTQNERNQYLQGQIKQLQARIDQIKDLESVRDRLLTRKQIIERLQSNRSQMVHLFDELVKTIPPSARLNYLSETGNKLTLRGVAQSNASVADYMRNIQASPWMGHVDLGGTKKEAKDERMPYSFDFSVSLSNPAEGDAEQGSTADVATKGGRR